MTRLPRVTGKEVAQVLRRADWRLCHTRGSHFYFRKGASIVCVPIHAGDVLPPKTLLSILKQTGLTLECFVELPKG